MPPGWREITTVFWKLILNFPGLQKVKTPKKWPKWQRGATQSEFGKTALQELLPFDRITRNAMLVLCPFMGAYGLSGGHWVKNIIFGFSSSRAVKKTPSERFKLDFESYRSYRCTLTLNGYKIKNHQKISRKQLVCGLFRSELSENNNNKSPRTRCRAVLATWKSTILSRKRFVNTFILQYLEN